MEYHASIECMKMKKKLGLKLSEIKSLKSDKERFEHRKACGMLPFLDTEDIVQDIPPKETKESTHKTVDHTPSLPGYYFSNTLQFSDDDVFDSDIDMNKLDEIVDKMKEEMGPPIELGKERGLTYADVHHKKRQRQFKKEKECADIEYDEDANSDDEVDEFIFNEDIEEDDIDNSEVVYISPAYFTNETMFDKTPEQIKTENELESNETEHYLNEAKRRCLYLMERKQKLERKKRIELGLPYKEKPLTEEELADLIKEKQNKIDECEKESALKLEEIRSKHKKRLDAERIAAQYAAESETGKTDSNKQVEIISSPEKGMMDQGFEDKGMCQEFLEEIEERTRLQKVLFPLESDRQQLEEQWLKLKRVKWLLKLQNEKQKYEKHLKDKLKKKEEEEAEEGKKSPPKRHITDIKMKVKDYTKFDDIKDEYLVEGRKKGEGFIEKEISSDEDIPRIYEKKIKSIPKLGFDYVELEDLDDEDLIKLEIEKPKDVKKPDQPDHKQIHKTDRKESILKQTPSAIIKGIRKPSTESFTEESSSEEEEIILSDTYKGRKTGKKIEDCDKQLYKLIFDKK